MANPLDQVGVRMMQLQQQGVSSIPLQAQAALADSGVSNPDFTQTANSLHAADKLASGSGSYFFDDPVLQKKETPALALKRYISGAIGPWPIQEENVGVTQQKLQQAGYGKGLNANGVFTPDWNAEWTKYKHDSLMRSKSGDTGGFWSAGLHDVMGALNDVLPVGALNSVLGFAKALPGEARNLVSDVGMAAGTAIGAPFGMVNAPGQGPNWGTAAGAGIQSALGHQENSAQYEKELLGGDKSIGASFEHLAGRAFDDVSTMLMLTPILGAASSAGAAAGETLLGSAAAPGSVGLAEAAGMAEPASVEAAAQAQGVVARGAGYARTPGTIGRWIGTGFAPATEDASAASRVAPFLKRTAGGAAVGGGVGAVGAGLAGRNPIQGAIYGAAVGGAGAGLLGTQAAENLPVLDRAAPLVRKIMGDNAAGTAEALTQAGEIPHEGYYYALRNKMVAPYQMEGAVGDATRALGQAQGKLALAGGVTGGLGIASSQLNGDQGYGAIGNEHTFDHINDSFMRFQKSTLHLPVAASLNDLAFLFHPPASGTDALIKSSPENLSPLHADAVAKQYGPVVVHWLGKDYNQLEAEFQAAADKQGGGDGQRYLSQWMNNRMDDVTANMAATRNVESSAAYSKGTLVRNSDEYYDAIRDEENRLKANRPQLHVEAMKFLSSPENGPQKYAEELIKSDQNNAIVAGEHANNAVGYIKASDVMKEDVLPQVAANARNMKASDQAFLDTAQHGEDIQTSLNDLQQKAAAATSPEDQRYYQLLHDTIKGAQSHVEKLGDNLSLASKSPRNVKMAITGKTTGDLNDAIQAQLNTAHENLAGALQEAANPTPGVSAAAAKVGEQAQHDFLTNHDMWMRSLGQHVDSNFLIHPGLEGNAANMGVARKTLLTYEDASSRANQLEHMHDAAQQGIQDILDRRSGKVTDQVENDFTEGKPWVEPPGLMDKLVKQKYEVEQQLFDMMAHELGAQSKDAYDFGTIKGASRINVDKPTGDLDFKNALEYARGRIDHLARRVTLAPDAPQALFDAESKLDGLGYKMVMGHDIGLDHIPYSLSDFSKGQYDRLTRMKDSVGLSAQPLSQSTIDVAHRNLLQKRIMGMVASGDLPSLPWMNARTYQNMVYKAYEAQRPGKPEQLAMTVSNMLGSFAADDQSPGFFKELMGRAGTALDPVKEGDVKTRMQLLRDENPGMKVNDLHDLARSQLSNEIGRQFGLLNMNRGQFNSFMMDPEQFREHAPQSYDVVNHERMIAGEKPIGALTLNQSNQLFQQVIGAYGDTPMRMVGLEKLEDMFRHSMAFAGDGKFNIHIPGVMDESRQINLGPKAGRVLGTAVLGAAAGVAASGKGSPGDYINNALTGAALGAVGAGVGNRLDKKGIVNADRWGWAVANLPNQLIKARNEFRFNLSPMFSLRRSVKTNVKMKLIAGVDPSLTPLSAIEAMPGGAEAALERLDRIQPDMRSTVGWDQAADAATMMIKNSDLFGIYNDRHYMAYAAAKMSQMGMDDAEIKDKLQHIFSYTTHGVVGRSALERSTNMVFFPFSFDKRMYGAMGTYLLNQPAQNVVLHGALTSYNEFQKSLDDKNPLSFQFWQAHSPIITEMANLNPLLHGVSIGQFGGINRPLMNMFLPQAWHPSQGNNEMLKAFIPAIKDMSDVMGQLADQGSIFKAASNQLYHQLPGVTPYTYANPGPSTLSPDAQLTAAFADQQTLYHSLAKILDYNSGKTKTAQIKFPTTPDYGQFGGLGITKANVRDLIAKRYPAYDPAKAVAIAVANAGDLNKYIIATNGTPIGDAVQQLIPKMQEIGNALGNNRYSAQLARDKTMAVRHDAILLAQKDPQFLKIYNKNFLKMFGPLEGVR